MWENNYVTTLPLFVLSNALEIADKVIGRAGGGREENSPEF
jgi:hypothetical protein